MDEHLIYIGTQMENAFISGFVLQLSNFLKTFKLVLILIRLFWFYLNLICELLFDRRNAADRDDGSKVRSSKSESAENRKPDSKLDSKEEKFETSSSANKDDSFKAQPSSPCSNKGSDSVMLILNN